MRKTFAILQASPRRLLSLLLIQILVALAAPQVGGSSAQTQSDIGILSIDRLIIADTPFTRTYQLVSRSSHKRVRMMFNKAVDANGTKRSHYTHLIFISDPSGAVKVRSEISRNYLCFGNKGRLTTRRSGKSPQCMFQEEVNNGYIKLRSYERPDWYVGFNRRGRKLKGYAKRDTWSREHCFQFTKIKVHRENRDREQLVAVSLPPIISSNSHSRKHR